MMLQHVLLAMATIVAGWGGSAAPVSPPEQCLPLGDRIASIGWSPSGSTVAVISEVRASHGSIVRTIEWPSMSITSIAASETIKPSAGVSIDDLGRVMWVQSVDEWEVILDAQGFAGVLGHAKGPMDHPTWTKALGPIAHLQGDGGGSVISFDADTGRPRRVLDLERWPGDLRIGSSGAVALIPLDPDPAKGTLGLIDPDGTWTWGSSVPAGARLVSFADDLGVVLYIDPEGEALRASSLDGSLGIVVLAETAGVADVGIANGVPTIAYAGGVDAGSICFAQLDALTEWSRSVLGIGPSDAR